MRIFFGKISNKVDSNQLIEGYYISPKNSSWFNGIDIGDLAYIIGGDKIQLWKAKSWEGIGTADERLQFEILNNDVGVKTKKFSLLKFFKLNVDLIVKTSRSTASEKKAFFPIVLDEGITIDDTYPEFWNEDSFRSIKLLSDKEKIIENSYDIQFYFDNEELKFYLPKNSDDSLQESFRDNLKYIGQGSPDKDRTLNKFKLRLNSTTSLSGVGLRALYDALWCEYKSKINYWVVNGYEQQYIDHDLQHNVFVMQFQYNYQKTSEVTSQLNKAKKIKPGDKVLLFNKNRYYAHALFKKRELNENIFNLNAQIKNKETRITGKLYTYDDAGCYFENLKSDGGFNSHFGQRLLVDKWKGINIGGLPISGIAKELENSITTNTILKLKDESFFNSVVSELEKKSNNVIKEIPVITYPLNQIFYGPPGTGKTYKTVSKAAEIITGQKLEIEEARKIFQENLGSRIDFITFHQNYSYEDFIQGLRPDVENKELSFQRNDGLFTQIATNALFEFYKLLEKQKLELNSREFKEPELSEVYVAYSKSLKKGQDFKIKSGSSIQIVGFSKNKNVEYAHFENGRPYLVSQDRLLKLYEAFPEIDQIQKIHEDIRAAIGGCNTTVYYVALREFIDFRKNYVKDYELDLSQEDRYDELKYDDISYERKKELLAKTALEQLRTINAYEVPSYVLIIDEINRANISRVFGELITLLEPDKRSHGKLPLTCTLPSGERFIVPSNLYLIGTMNTADKSIALLDIALRRRFEFVPMYPDINVDGVQRTDILEKINSKITSLKTKDFTIGHSYFMGDDFDLKKTIDKKIIPLLLEYFMNDEKEVIGILDFAGLEIGNWPLEFIKEKAND